MSRDHLAQITWSAAQVRAGLPVVTETIDPAWLPDTGATTNEGWSLVCRFAAPAAEQGNPSRARVHFLVPDAPHDHLRPGALLSLYERATNMRATVEILE